MSAARDIDEARALLEKSERELDPLLKANDLLKGLDILGACEEDDITEPERILIKNVRAAHARRLLTQLVKLQSTPMEVWLRYVGLLLGMLRPEVDDALAADPSLKENYDRFVSLWRNELRDMLRVDIFDDNDRASGKN